MGRSKRVGTKVDAAVDFNVTWHDMHFANASRVLGFDSLQIRSGGAMYGGSQRIFHVQTNRAFEIVATGSACATDAVEKSDLMSRNLTSACPPMLLRTGWNASRPCECDYDSSPLLNCMGDVAINELTRAHRHTV